MNFSMKRFARRRNDIIQIEMICKSGCHFDILQRQCEMIRQAVITMKDAAFAENMDPFPKKRLQGLS
jgi:hypothetical protein